MAMKVCKDCGNEVSKSAKVCPKCGRKLKNGTWRVVLGVILFWVIVIGIAGSMNNTDSNKDNNTKMTLEKFNQIETGMTYQQVVDIAGEEGTLSTESAYGDSEMKIYYWYSSNGMSNATVSFMNGTVTAKSQIGLE